MMSDHLTHGVLTTLFLTTPTCFCAPSYRRPTDSGLLIKLRENRRSWHLPINEVDQNEFRVLWLDLSLVSPCFNDQSPLAISWSVSFAREKRRPIIGSTKNVSNNAYFCSEKLGISRQHDRQVLSQSITVNRETVHVLELPQILAETSKWSVWKSNIFGNVASRSSRQEEDEKWES